MNKTPEQVKEGLACHGWELCDKRCPYGDMHGTGYDCSSQLCGDALILYERLEAENAELLTKVEQLEAKCHQLERERDSALTDLREAVQRGCWSTCKHGPVNAGNDCKKANYQCERCREKCLCKLCEVEGTKDFYEWRGVKEE